MSSIGNKKWDKTIKGLTKHNLAKVYNTVEGLFIELVDSKTVIPEGAIIYSNVKKGIT